MTISLNDIVRVRLTAKGRAMVYAYYAGLSCDPPKDEVAEPAEMTLWKLAQLLGPGLYLGAEPPPCAMTIEIVGGRT